MTTETETTTQRLARWREYLERDSGAVPCSRYGRNSADCAPYAMAAQLIYEECNGSDDLDLDSLDYMMGLVVNDHDDIAYLLREYSYCLPAELLDQLDPEVWQDNGETETDYDG